LEAGLPSVTKARHSVLTTAVSSHPPITSGEGCCMWDFDDCDDEDAMDDFIVFLRAKP